MDGKLVVYVSLEDSGKRKEGVVYSWSRVSAFEDRDNRGIFPKNEDTSIVNFVVSFTYKERVLFTVNKEEFRKPLRPSSAPMRNSIKKRVKSGTVRNLERSAPRGGVQTTLVEEVNTEEN